MISNFLSYSDLAFPSLRATSTVKDGVTTISYPIPGLSKDDIHVQVSNDVLSIEAKGRNLASYSLYGEEVSGIKAVVKNGLLTIQVPQEAPVIVPITEG